MPVYAIHSPMQRRMREVARTEAEAFDGLREVAGVVFDLELGNGWTLPVIITELNLERPLEGLMRITGRFEAHGAPRRDTERV